MQDASLWLDVCVKTQFKLYTCTHRGDVRICALGKALPELGCQGVLPLVPVFEHRNDSVSVKALSIENSRVIERGEDLYEEVQVSVCGEMLA